MKKYRLKDIENPTLEDLFECAEQIKNCSDKKSEECRQLQRMQAYLTKALDKKVVVTNDDLAKLMTQKTGKLWKICEIHDLFPDLDPAENITSYYAICETNENFNPTAQTCKLREVSNCPWKTPVKYEIEGISNSEDCTRISFISAGEGVSMAAVRAYKNSCGNTNWFYNYITKKYPLNYVVGCSYIKGYYFGNREGARIPENEVGKLMFETLDEYFQAERAKLSKKNVQESRVESE